MKKVLPIVLFVIILGGVWYLTKGGDSGPAGNSSSSTTASTATSSSAGGTQSGPLGAGITATDEPGGVNEETDFFDEEIKPAAEVYAGAADALEAVRKGAGDYNDLILEQFVQPGPDCGWCPEFFANVNELMLSEESSDDEKSYYAEILAISGKVDNISALINAIQDSSSEDLADIYAEALEVTVGDDDVVGFLSTQLESDNELIKESAIAAITNHGSLKTVETLFDQTVKSKDPDGYYSLGIGLGEVIPDDEAMPRLRQIATKGDEYSHLAIKAILNKGNEGLKSVFEIIKNQPPEVAAKLLVDAVDHVAYEEGTEEVLKNELNNSADQASKSFAEEIMEDLDITDEDLN